MGCKEVHGFHLRKFSATYLIVTCIPVVGLLVILTREKQLLIIVHYTDPFEGLFINMQ